GRVRYEYDDAGRTVLRQVVRLSKKPDTWRYEWDAEDRLTMVITPDGTSWRYAYDPLGRRIGKHGVAADGTVVGSTAFTWQESTLIEQTENRSGRPLTLTWEYQEGRPLTQIQNAPQAEIDRRFFAVVTDLVGAPTHLIGDNGEVAWRARTTLWGQTTGTGTTTMPLRFPGQYADEETGWHYNYHRHYDPHTARYTTPDPLGLDPGPHPYAYVHNPHTWSDPLGLAAHRPRAQHLQPDENATGSHTVFERDASGRVTRYQTWIEEPRAPSGWRQGPRFRGEGKPHAGIEPPLYYPTGGGRAEPATGENLPLGY
ncbi:type IV secretion protein Rhs, partial [Streptomyces klenkii]